MRTGLEVDDVEGFGLCDPVRSAGIGATAEETPLLRVLFEITEHGTEIIAYGLEIRGEYAEGAAVVSHFAMA